MSELKHPNFVGKNNKVFCVKCQKCGIENYGPAVATGICAMCGEDHNKLREKLCDCNRGTLKIRK